MTCLSRRASLSLTRSTPRVQLTSKTTSRCLARPGACTVRPRGRMRAGRPQFPAPSVPARLLRRVRPPPRGGERELPVQQCGSSAAAWRGSMGTPESVRWWNNVLKCHVCPVAGCGGHGTFNSNRVRGFAGEAGGAQEGRDLATDGDEDGAAERGAWPDHELADARRGPPGEQPARLNLVRAPRRKIRGSPPWEPCAIENSSCDVAYERGLARRRATAESPAWCASSRGMETVRFLF